MWWARPWTSPVGSAATISSGPGPAAGPPARPARTSRPGLRLQLLGDVEARLELVLVGLHPVGSELDGGFLRRVELRPGDAAGAVGIAGLGEGRPIGVHRLRERHFL